MSSPAPAGAPGPAAPDSYAVTVPVVDDKAIKKAQRRDVICNTFLKIGVLVLILALLAIPIAVPLVIQKMRQEPEQLVFYSNNAKVPGLIVDKTYTIITNTSQRQSASTQALNYFKNNRPPTMVITDASAGIPTAPPGFIQIVAQPPLAQFQDPLETTPAEMAHSFTRWNKTTSQQERFCRPYYTAGFNLENMVEASMLEDPWYGATGDMTGRQVVDDILQRAAAEGLTTVRVWAHTQASFVPFQILPGQYSERGLKGLDYTIDAARRAGLQVVLSMADNWKYYNGLDQYVDWSKTAPARTQDRPLDVNGDFDGSATTAYEVKRHTLFWTDPDARQFFKDHLATILNRNNTFSGRVYKDDPTIYAISLVNEPRCDGYTDPACNGYVQDWLEEMAAFVKTIDSKHMLTIGNEGFFAGADKAENPVLWGDNMGQDFTKNGAVPEVDFVTIHMWPDNWDLSTSSINTFAPQWVNSHLRRCESVLKKPLMFEEFGKKLTKEQRNSAMKKSLRDPVYQATYAAADQAVSNSSYYMGTLFWRQGYFLYNTNQDTYDVLLTDSTYAYIREHAKTMNKKTNSQPPRPDCNLGCWVPKAGSKPGAQDCENSPGVCAAWWQKFGGAAAGGAAITAEQTVMAQAIKDGKTPVYPTRNMCCRPGVGAFVTGCTVTQSPPPPGE